MSDMQPNLNPYGPAAPYNQAYMPAPGMPGSISGPLKAIGIIYLVFGALAVLGSLFIVGAGFAALHGSDGDNVGAMFIFIAAAVIVIIGLLQAVMGYGLFTFKHWARTPAIVVSAITLLSIPFGTVLGGFALYYLLKQNAAQEYAMLSAANDRL